MKQDVADVRRLLAPALQAVHARPELEAVLAAGAVVDAGDGTVALVVTALRAVAEEDLGLPSGGAEHLVQHLAQHLDAHTSAFLRLAGEVELVEDVHA